jgi:hypothetical protein
MFIFLALAIFLISWGFVAGRGGGRAAPVWPGRAAWALAAMLLTGALLTMASIGLILAPFAVVALAVVIRRFSYRGAASGVPAGAGISFIALGIANLGNLGQPPCSAVPQILLPGQHSTAPCGGSTPVPWLIVGACSLALAAGAFVLETRRFRVQPR